MRNSVQDVTYHIKAIKNNRILFDGDCKTDNGVLRLEFIPTDNEQIETEEKRERVVSSIGIIVTLTRFKTHKLVT